MSDPALRQIMATHILNYEARRDRAGRLCADRAGGVPGLTGAAAKKVAGLLEAGEFARAEAAAVQAVARYSDKVVGVATDPGVEFVLRDICWQAGPKGANEAVQRALGLNVTGVLDEAARGEVRLAECRAHGLVKALEKSRGVGLVSDADWKRWGAVSRIAFSLSPRRYIGDGMKAA